MCTPVVFTVLPNAGGKSPVFSVNLAQTRFLTQSTSLQTFGVRATVDVTWTNGKRDSNLARVNLDSSVYVDSSSAALPDDESYASSGSILGSSLMIFFVLFVNVFLL